jgi:uncharacterized protein YbjT (DUF2867 family)
MSTTRAYLITGATGNVGSRVTERLLERGIQPRVFVRDADKARAQFGERVDVAVGDLADASSLKEALRGIDRLFLVNAGHDLAVRDEAAAAAARAAGVDRLVKLSTFDVQQSVGTGVWHARGEAAIRRSGVGFTFVRPSGFMVNALAWAPAIRSGNIVRGATGDGRIAFIHPQDIADVVVAVLTGPQYAGQSLPITGPVALSYGEMIARIGAAIGRPFAFQPTTDEEERQRWLERGEPPESIDYHLDIFRAIRDGRLAGVTDQVQRVLGRAPITFDQWVRENAAEFRAPVPAS